MFPSAYITINNVPVTISINEKIIVNIQKSEVNIGTLSNHIFNIKSILIINGIETINNNKKDSFDVDKTKHPFYHNF